MSEAVTELPGRRREPVEPRWDPSVLGDETRGDGVTLRRLLAVAALTRAQTALLVDDLICRVERRQRGGPSRLRDDAVTVSETGRLTIAWNGSATDGHAADESVARLLGSIVTSCRCPEWADRVSESIGEATDLEDLMHRVRRVVAADRDPAEESRVRSQLAALVAVVAGRRVPDDPVVARAAAPRGPGSGAGTSLAPAGWYPPAGSGWHRRRRRPSRRQGVLGLVALLILVGTLWAAPRVWAELRRGWDAVLNRWIRRSRTGSSRSRLRRPNPWAVETSRQQAQARRPPDRSRSVRRQARDRSGWSPPPSPTASARPDACAPSASTYTSTPRHVSAP